MDDVVERVARALAADAWHDEPDEIDQMAVDFIGLAKAAIRAVLEGLEPVALILDHVDGEREFVRASMRLTDGDKRRGWTETPLYDLSAIKEAVK